MTTVIVSGAGTSGPRGPGWLTGAGVPAGTLGFDGDMYLDTTNVGFYYGAKTNGAWGTPHPFGNSLNGVPLTNVTATTAPTVANDSTQGYSRGSTWINTVTNVSYVCTNAAIGAAAWQATLPTGTGNLPAAGQILTATSPSAAAWSIAPGTYPSTGMVGGGLFTINTATSFSISAGSGVIVNYSTNFAAPTVSLVTIAPQVKTLSAGEQARILSYWLVDGNGNVTSQAGPPTADQRRTSIFLGTTAFVAGALEAVDNSAVYVPQIGNQLYDVMNYLGTFVTGSGCRVVPNGANLSFNVSGGTIVAAGFNYGNDVNNPHLVTYPVLTLAQFFRATQVAGSEVLTTTLDPTHYDVNGTITLVGGGTNTSTIQRVYLFPPGSVSSLVVAYDQTTYGSLSAAVSAAGSAPSSYVVNPDFATGTIIAYICMTRICTSLQDTVNCTIISAGKFASP